MTQEHAFSAEQAPPTRIPGAVVLGDRYRLLVKSGSIGSHTFWQAMDTHLNRHVALIFTSHAAPEALRAAMVLAKISSPGLARIFDITNDQGDLVVITEWVAGAALQDVALSRPSALGSANAVTAIADAAAAAHAQGALLGLDDPLRVRISNDGEAVLAFPSVSGQHTRTDDVKALGATLYTLLTGQWPDVTQDTLASAHSLNSDVPRLLSQAADSALEGKVSAEKYREILEQILTNDEELIEESTENTPPGNSGLQLDLGLDSGSAGKQTPDSELTPPASNSKTATTALRDRMGEVKNSSRRTLIVAGALILAIIVGVGYGVYSLVESVSNQAKDGRPLVPGQPKSNAVSGPTTSVKAQNAQVVDFRGDPSTLDSPRDAKNAIDGESSTFWQTDQYRDGPKMVIKPGVGLLLTLTQAVRLQQVGISSASQGTQVEIYVPSSSKTTASDVKKLSDLVKIGSGQINGPVTNIACNPERVQASTVVVVWITSLTPVNSQYRSRVNELSFRGVTA